jgi:type VI protein secretion system component VasK
MLAAIPALYLAVWWLLIPLWPNTRYAHWRAPYLWLLALALMFEVLNFLVPIWSFHRAMQAQKTELLQTADQLSRRVVEIQAALADVQDEQAWKALKDQLPYLTQQFLDIETMSTWPLDSRIRRRFTLNNVGLFIP